MTIKIRMNRINNEIYFYFLISVELKPKDEINHFMDIPTETTLNTPEIDRERERYFNNEIDLLKIDEQ